MVRPKFTAHQIDELARALEERSTEVGLGFDERRRRIARLLSSSLTMRVAFRGLIIVERALMPAHKRRFAPRPYR